MTSAFRGKVVGMAFYGIGISFLRVADNPDRMRATSNELMDRLSLDRRGYRRSNSRTLITYLQVTRFLFSTDNAKLLAYAITDITREPVRDYGHGNLE